MIAGRAQFILDIQCPECGQRGMTVWEEDDGFARGPKRKRALILIAGGFHAENGRTKSGDPAIICDACGAPQQD